MYYVPMTIVNEDSRVIAKLETLLTDDARVIIYDRHMFIVQATGWIKKSVLYWTQVCQVLCYSSWNPFAQKDWFIQGKTQQQFGSVNVA